MGGLHSRSCGKHCVGIPERGGGHGRERALFGMIEGRILMKRRKFLTALGAGAAAAAATAIAKPAIAQFAPTLKWRLTASWPKSLDTLYGTCER